MPADLTTKYRKLDAKTRHVVQLFAVSDLIMNRQDIVSLSSESGWTDSRGKSLTKTEIGKLVNSLMSKDILLQGSYSSMRVNPAVQDLAIQDSVRGGWFEALSQVVEQRTAKSHYYRNNIARDLRFAFYGNEVQSFKALTKGKVVDPNARLLDPFSRDIFDQLDPVLQEMYLADVVPREITAPDTKDVFTAFDEAAARIDAPSNDFIASWLELAVARGDLDSIRRLHDLTRNKLNEVAGCLALLTGDFEQAEVSLRAAMPGGKRKSSLAIGRLPAVLYLLLLMKNGTGESLSEARSIIAAATKARKGRYAALMEIASAAISFKQSPSSPAKFASQLATMCRSPLETLLAAYFSAWLLTEEDTSIKVGSLVKVASRFRSVGLDWFAAEVSGLAGKSSLKSAADQAQRHAETHERLGTISLVNLVEPEPVWMRSLSAIAQLAGGEPALATSVAAPESERLIWELDPRYSSISLDAFHQKRSGSGWSKGRKVADKRLYENFNEPEFAFLTEQDRELCRSIECEVSRNHYGYTEEYYGYADVRAARALIGHPCVFRPGKRDSPLEIVEQQPRLIVAQETDGRISLSLDPKPQCDETDLRLIKDGPQRVAIVFFDES
ncbi:MAG: hypothetical protein KDB27_03555, partial [Planctomycetales bacterium]|nr:hypothetical protein [Planctomycetales bacterium]